MCMAASCAACVQGAAVLTHGQRSIGQRFWFNAVLDDTRIHARSPRVSSSAEIRHLCTGRGSNTPDMPSPCTPVNGQSAPHPTPDSSSARASKMNRAGVRSCRRRTEGSRRRIFHGVMRATS
ncbi:hypothetical protein PR001_g7576 [Phytophthora rubi]|uniref:Uncharacterized protein n=1 Tax=Phytophthora rubi TaxID=129364 RepID=A0A6A3NDC3_9STRA|nr:hypothetical protein PR001_g7576 [Phytophthora rubi]